MGSSPSVKETTLHHYRDPLAACLSEDSEVDFLGVILQATSDSQERKELMARRTGNMAAGMHPDGVLVCIDAWGNAHIDFAGVIEAVGQKGIPLVGLTFTGRQASFVVVNDYMKDAIIDLNKNAHGMENNILADNTVTPREACQALDLLKKKIRQASGPGARPAAMPASGSREPEARGKLLGHLKVRHFQIREVRPTAKIAYQDGVLNLNLDALEQAVMERVRAGEPALQAVREVKFRIIRPGEHDVTVNTILDVSPLAVKTSGELGSGVTRLFKGLQVMLCAVEEGGFQPMNCGAATGRLSEAVKFGRCGSPALDDIILHADVLLSGNGGHTREGIMAAHLACDLAVEEIRECLRYLDISQSSGQDMFIDAIRPGRLRIALIKMTSGVSAMGDTALFPRNPGGFIGAGSVIDLLQHFPVLLSPNEYRDGIVHSLT